jgi:hypothetical protein
MNRFVARARHPMARRRRGNRATGSAAGSAGARCGPRTLPVRARRANPATHAHDPRPNLECAAPSAGLDATGFETSSGSRANTRPVAQMEGVIPDAQAAPVSPSPVRSVSKGRHWKHHAKGRGQSLAPRLRRKTRERKAPQWARVNRIPPRKNAQVPHHGLGSAPLPPGEGPLEGRATAQPQPLPSVGRRSALRWRWRWRAAIRCAKARRSRRRRSKRGDARNHAKPGRAAGHSARPSGTGAWPTPFVPSFANRRRRTRVRPIEIPRLVFLEPREGPGTNGVTRVSRRPVAPDSALSAGVPPEEPLHPDDPETRAMIPLRAVAAPPRRRRRPGASPCARRRRCTPHDRRSRSPAGEPSRRAAALNATPGGAFSSRNDDSAAAVLRRAPPRNPRRTCPSRAGRGPSPASPLHDVRALRGSRDATPVPPQKAKSSEGWDSPRAAAPTAPSPARDDACVRSPRSNLTRPTHPTSATSRAGVLPATDLTRLHRLPQETPALSCSAARANAPVTQDATARQQPIRAPPPRTIRDRGESAECRIRIRVLSPHSP